MRTVIACLLAFAGLVFLVGSFGLGVYLHATTEDGIAENALQSVVIAGVGGLFTLCVGYSLLEALTQEKRKTTSRLKKRKEATGVVTTPSKTDSNASAKDEVSVRDDEQ